MVANIKRYWLRKRGTNLTYQRTAVLAARPDMEAVDEKKAKELQAAEIKRRAGETAAIAAANQGVTPASEARQSEEDEEKQRQIAAGIIPETDNPEEPKQKTLEEMNEAECKAMLTEMKLPVNDSDTLEIMKETLKAVISADNKAVDDGDAPVKFAAEDPAAPAEEPTAPPASDIAGMSYKDLQAACKAAGKSGAGNKADLIARLQE